jgi:predicted transcriptional regulator
MSKFNYLSIDGIEKFTFYRMPKLLFTDNYFINLTCEAKVLYGLLLDRATLSKNNDWIDEEGKVFVFFKQDDVMDMLNIKKNKVIAIFKELEDIGLIIRKKLGQGNPTRIYVMNFSDATDVVDDEQDENTDTDFVQTSSKNIKKEVKRFEKPTSEIQTSSKNIKKEVKRFEKPTSEIQTSTENTKKEVKRFEKPTSKGLKNKLLASNYINNTEKNNTESIYLSSKAEKPTSKVGKDNDGLIEEYDAVVNDVKSQISYPLLIKSGYEKSTLDLIVSLIADVYTDNCSSITANGMTVPAIRVRREYKKLTEEHIKFVLDCVNRISSDKKINNIRTYLQACLFNAPNTISISYDNEVNFDFG